MLNGRVKVNLLWNRAARGILLLPLLLLTGGCGSEADDPAAGDVPVPVAPSAESETVARQAESTKGSAAATEDVAGTEARRFGQLRLEIPSSWRENQLSGIRATILDASYGIPAADEAIEVTFSTIGGGISDNLSRWEGQFQREPGDSPVRRTIDVDGTDATWVEISGTFTARAAGNPGPHPEWMLLGAAIPLGDRDFYVKLTGPRAAVIALKDSVFDMVKSARLE